MTTSTVRPISHSGAPRLSTSNGLPIFSAFDDFGGDHWFGFYIEGCFDPPVIAVRADTWEDAYYNFLEIPSTVSATEITPDIADDYPPEDEFGTYNDSGNRLDTESIGTISSNPIPLYLTRFTA